ncbi:MAG: 5'-methylthioadenosine/adenosylhomocysteine nucleosidase [Defluviitaleaceae bacterium]|nr:5'-methylthioadenosine/adenosylhomocysteine nucleosidase [Defluviitaleaceae bacterium]
MIGIIGAMAIEVDGLLAVMENTEKTTISGMDFFAGKIVDKPTVVARCGIGKVHAAMCAQTMITGFTVTAVINLGVAGAIDNALNIGDVVVSHDLIHHDAMATTFGYPVGQIPGIDVLAFAADDGLVKSAISAYETVFTGGTNKAHHGRIATGDQFVNTAAQKQQISDNFTALCVEMEGAAIAQVCYINKIPFVVIRAISDKADGSADMDFEKFVMQAAENSTKVVVRMMEGWL